MEGGQGPQRGPIGGGMARSDGVTRWPGGRNFSDSLYGQRFLRYGHFPQTIITHGHFSVQEFTMAIITQGEEGQLT